MKRQILVTITLLIIVALVLVKTNITVSNEEEERKIENTIDYSDHSGAFKALNITVYEGSKTCIKCHEQEVKDVFHSAHYQLANKIEINGETLYYGGRYAYNDYCGAIFWNGEVPVNWIGNATLKVPPPGKEELKGKFIASGCSMCHGVSLGIVPKPELTEEQLENIDCLVCHHDEYKGGSKGIFEGWRILVKTENGFRYQPNPNINITELAEHIVGKPTKDSCLWCHAFSGGGPGFKRPNINPSLIGNVSKEVDVHLASGMSCVDCHEAKEHKFGSWALDTWFRETSEVPKCESCHEERHEGFTGWFIRTFHDRVACQTCHIPVIGKTVPTDVHRDWSQSEFNEKLGRYEPIITLEGNVTPVYMWWNEKNVEVYLYPQKASLVDDTLIYFKPVGSKDDEKSKIYPFKYHEAIIPFDEINNIPVPVKVGIVFATGNTQLAAQAGAKIAGLNFTGKYIKYVRFMAVNHGVVPKEEALGCLDCHGVTIKRMDWKSLGYGIYPEVAFASIIIGIIIVIGIVVFIIYRKTR